MGVDLFTKKTDNKKIKKIENFYNDGNFIAALKEIEHYLTLYPRDLKVLFYKGKILRMLKIVDGARNVFLELLPIVQYNEYESKILIELIYLEIYNRNYLSAYSYLKRLQKSYDFKNIKGLNFDLAEIYLCHQCNIEIESSRENNYFGKQITDYSEERFMKRLLNNNLSSMQILEGFRRFSGDVDLQDLYERIKGIISLARVTPAYNVFDTYIFEYPDVGYDEAGELNHVQVLAYTNVGGGVFILEISPFRVKRYKSYVNDIIDLECQLMFLEDEVKLQREI